MTFILRLPAILALLALVLASLAAAFAATVVLASLPVDLGAVLSEDQIADVGASTWLEAGLWFGAGALFLIAAIRLMRRTQGFWVWLLGFACYGGRWAVVQESGPGETMRNLDPNAYLKPEVLLATPESSEAQLGVLGIVFIVGLLILIIDAADRSYWDRQEG